MSKIEQRQIPNMEFSASVSRLRWSALNVDPKARNALIEDKAKEFLTEHGSLTFRALRENGMSGLSHGIERYYPGGLYGLQEKYGVAKGKKHKPKGYWTESGSVEKIKEEVGKFYKKEGELSFMILAKKGRSDLIGAIRSYPGGWVQLGRDLGFKTRIVKRGFWTEDQIKKEAKQFLAETGSLTCPALREAGRADLLAAIQRKYPGNITQLKKDLNMGFVRKGKRYWKDPQIVEKEALAFNQKHGWITQNLMFDNRRIDLWTAIIRYYPGGIKALREKLGIPDVKPEEQISPDQANAELMKLLEEKK